MSSDRIVAPIALDDEMVELAQKVDELAEKLNEEKKSEDD